MPDITFRKVSIVSSMDCQISRIAMVFRLTILFCLFVMG